GRCSRIFGMNLGSEIRLPMGYGTRGGVGTVLVLTARHLGPSGRHTDGKALQGFCSTLFDPAGAGSGGDIQAERDEAIRKAAAAKDRALQFLSKPSIPNRGVASPRSCDLTLDTGEGSSLDGKALAVWEQIVDLRCEGPELPEESGLL
ncbi:hypothetical protein ACLOJK_029346, partial [Asimina triloba]